MRLEAAACKRLRIRRRFGGLEVVTASVPGAVHHPFDANRLPPLAVEDEVVTVRYDANTGTKLRTGGTYAG